MEKKVFVEGVKANALWEHLSFRRQHDAHEALRLILNESRAMHGACSEETCAAGVAETSVQRGAGRQAFVHNAALRLE